MNTELLAPAKDKETAIEAINCGADAVYIGATAFGARKNVPNSIEDIKAVVDYAHKFWAKVFVTINTILTDSEVLEAIELIKKLTEIGIDAVIIQDLGLLDKLIELLNSGYKLPAIHMSTQCDNYLPQKIKFFREMGVSRVILAREASLEQINQIHSENPNLELEAFVHGALCVSMSGQCYLSQYIGGRSANRGECAQPCRKKYTVETADGKVIKKDFYALCLKDFNASNKTKELIDAGICSFKIEGRLKDVGYVKNIVSYYREKLGKGSSSGKSFITFIPNPEKSFNRGFTEYFLNGRENCFNQESPKSKGEYLGEVVEIKNNCFKLKTNKKINPQDGIYFNGDGFKVNKVENGFIYPNRKVNLKKGDKLWRNFDSEFEKDLLKQTKRQIGINVKIDSNKIFIVDENGITISRELTQQEKSNNPSKMKETFIKQFSKTGESDFYVEDITVESELPFLPVSEINSLRRELLINLMEKRIQYYDEKIKQTQQPIQYSKYYLNEVDYKANIHNKYAKEFYEKSGVNVLELSLESQIPNRQVELMHCKHCIKDALNMCKSPEKLVLRDEFNKIYPLKFDCKKCEMFILSNF